MTNKRKKSTKINSLSSENINQKNKAETMTEEQLKTLQDKVFGAINNIELQKSMDKWIKEQSHANQIVRRDISILKNALVEYLDSFLVLGYTMEGDRIVMQHFKTPKDRDAIVEFLKTIFLKQQHENFLDEQ
jgi:hypothetical protein